MKSVRNLGYLLEIAVTFVPVSAKHPGRWPATVALAVLAVVAAGAAPAVAGSYGQEADVPQYQNLRFEEDWSFLGDPGRTTGDAFDQFKHVALSDDGQFWISFGGQLRGRVELWDDFNFGATGSDDEDDVFLLHRLRAHADLHAGEMLRMFVELKSAIEIDRELPGGARTLDEDDFELQNGFVDLRLPLAEGDSITFRGGRHEIAFGAERLVSPLDWSNTRRTFDGASVIWDAFNWTIHGFVTYPVEIQKHNFNEPDEDQQFYGIYTTAKQPFGDIGPDVLELYWLGLERENTGFNFTSGEEDRHTLGTRLKGPIGGTNVDYEVEAAYQFGDVSGADINAFMVTGELGIDVSEEAEGLRLVAGVDYASGDDDPADGDVETFNQLFPLGHAHLGYIDMIGRQNIVDLRGRATLVPFGTMRATIDTHYFLRASDDDALYDAGGNVVRPGFGSDDNDIGLELDLTLKQRFGRHLDLVFGYSHFFTGDFIEESGPDEDIDFAYVQGQFTF